jgi:anti-sigma B factor antagonist
MRAPDTSVPVEVIRTVPVVAAPEDIDITNAAGLRTALLQAAALGRGTFVVDMSHTQFCDTAGIHALVGAYKRARTGGGQVLLVIGGAAVHRILSITGLDRVIPSFQNLEQALAHTLPARQDPK